MRRRERAPPGALAWGWQLPRSSRPQAVKGESVVSRTTRRNHEGSYHALPEPTDGFSEPLGQGALLRNILHGLVAFEPAVGRLREFQQERTCAWPRSKLIR